MGSSFSRYWEVALPSTPPVNAVYYPSWYYYNGKPPSVVQAEIVTHVYYAFVGVYENGTLQSLDEYADFEAPIDKYDGCIDALGGLKERNPSLKTLVSLGGASASDAFPTVAASKDSRQELASQVRSFCDRHGLDGVDIDWEHPETPEQGRDFVKLVKALREALPAGDYLVTAALPTTTSVLDNIDLWEAARALDFLNLMAYDFTGNWTALSGNHAQLWPPAYRRGSAGAAVVKRDADLRLSGSEGVEYVWKEGVPVRKIVLGVPAYARYFPGAAGYGEPFDTAQDNEIDYCDVLNASAWQQASTVSVDEEAVAASYVDKSAAHGDGGGSNDGMGFVSLDVPQTVAMKASYAKCMGLGGLFYWHGAGDKRGNESLVSTGYRILAQ